MSHELQSPDLQLFLDRLAPARHAEMTAMEEYADLTNFPIIGPASGQFLYVLSRLSGAREVFELGSGYGYSTAWFAMAVRDNGGGVVHHTVWDERLSAKAREHLSAMGFSVAGEDEEAPLAPGETRIVFRVAEAVGALREIGGTFDVIFNDIDKHAYPQVIPLAETKLRPGGLLIADNVLWSGRIFEPEDETEDTEGVRAFTEEIARSERWSVTIAPIRDGMLVAYRR